MFVDRSNLFKKNCFSKPTLCVVRNSIQDFDGVILQKNRIIVVISVFRTMLSLVLHFNLFFVSRLDIIVGVFFTTRSSISTSK